MRSQMQKRSGAAFESNDSIQRRISKFAVGISIWRNPLVNSIVSALKRNPVVFGKVAEKFQMISEGYELDLFKMIIKPGMTVIDIGANVGLYTLQASRLVGKSGKVIAFEPDPYNFDILSKRTKAFKNSNVILEKLALSDKSGTTQLYIDDFNIGNHSMAQRNLYVGKKSIEVTTTTLDEYLRKRNIPQVDVIKTDVQGAEALVFEGAKSLLRSGNAAVLMEFWPQGILNMHSDPFACLRKLKAYGYRFFVVDKKKRCLRRSDLDELFKESKRWVGTTDYTNILLRKKK